jgi:hypothetical protein
MTSTPSEHDFGDLRAMFINTTLKRSPEVSKDGERFDMPDPTKVT